MSSRPKPRPRPRPRAPAPTIDTTVPPSSSPGVSPVVVSQPRPIATLQSIEDEDELFMRNRKRTAADWKQLSKATAEKPPLKRKSSPESSDEEDSSRGHPRKKKPAKSTKGAKSAKDELPDWTKKKLNEIILSSDSEDSDDDLLMGRKRASGSEQGERSSPRKSKRRRSRSRSITPPPAVPEALLQRARKAVREIVGTSRRSPSPVDDADESVDTIVLDAELASIVQQVRNKARLNGASSSTDTGGPPIVSLKVNWKPHPLNPQGSAEIWGFTQKRHDSFHQMFGEVADLAAIPVDNLVVTFEGNRVFPSSNPHGMNIWAEAELDACDKTTFEYLKEHRRMATPAIAPQVPNVAASRGRSPSIQELTDSDSENIPPTAQDTGDAMPSTPSSPAEAFHLIVRSERTKDKDITLLVRPKTKCGAIVRGFLKKAGLEAEYPEETAPPPPKKGRGRGKAAAAAAAKSKVPALSVDGEKMDPDAEIGVMDLEDGDMVEVIGL